MTAGRVPYLISRYCLRQTEQIKSNSDRTLDPVFALGVGATAAGIKIRREEVAKGHTSKDTVDALKRRARLIGKIVGLG